ncbi:hypothetical protein acsn021_20510 [Anaerocolumna cellulosilytica]|uniref:Uncharacterized protein n=1 Tax=Anaerocolumna cellulosilytica TaxID=433286 RepID=A0A6S6R4U7_9FIRM|nr:right-handed parallel beta-helix repeat-containing protein [Anaerocolumna cellulosilytica]MBB5196396.1 parallel beta-helix repeat protein [Anaerocolumna cellulosilytica]BCJ94482.1 hypothetical protein acsn021_20510 [Anaerocolumna cellulosilytica]
MRNKIFKFTIFILLVFIAINFQLPVNAEALNDKSVYAVPDTTSTQLQELLDYNKYGGYDLTVYIPAGEYTLNKELRIYSNTTIIADKDAKLMKNHQKGAMIANDLSKDKGGYNTTKNITIDGGVWDSSRIATKGKGTESLRFIHATNVTIKNAVICNVPENSHLVTFAGVRNGTVDNCTLFGYKGSNFKEAIQIDIVHNNVVVPSMQSDVLKYDDLACDGITIKNSEIYNYPRAIGSHTSIKGVFHKNIKITGNNLHDIDEAAIKAYNYVNLEVSNNKISNVGIGVLAYTFITNQAQHYLPALKTTKKEPLPATYNIVIKNNQFYQMKQIDSKGAPLWGDAIRTIGIKSRPLTGVTITNNTINHADRYGMFLQGSPGCTISENTIRQTTNSGIYIIGGSDYSEVLNNNLTRTGAYGTEAGGIGLSTSKDVTIEDNMITSPGKSGIFLYSDSKSGTISNNSIQSAGVNAIALYDNSDEALITNNTITAYRKRGIFINNTSSAILTYNTITGTSELNSEDAIHINGEIGNLNNFILKENTIQTANRYGIYVSNAPKSYIGSNTIIDTVKQAIYLDSGSNETKIYYNTITNAGFIENSKMGIAVSGSKKVLLYGNYYSL